MQAEDHNGHGQDGYNYASTDDEERSMMEDDSDGEDHMDDGDYDDEDDGSSSLSIPNESIDFDLVYSLHSFAATVEGQANVVKGDSLFLMDDSNSYWWLVRVLKTQEVGYIPAENIETPFERLARLNKHRNVDLASATQAELQEDIHRIRNFSRGGSSQTPSPIPGNSVPRRTRTTDPKGVAFTPSLSVHRYPPAVWNEEEEEEEDIEWDLEGYEDEDPSLAEEQLMQMRAEAAGSGQQSEPDDGMSWEGEMTDEMQARQALAAARGPQGVGLPPRPARGDLQQQQQQQQQMQQQQLQQQQLQQQQLQQQALAQQQEQAAAQAEEQRLRQMQQDSQGTQPLKSSRSMDPLDATETRKMTTTPTIARSSPNEGPLLPSAVMQQQDEERKRTREEIEALEEAAKKKGKGKGLTINAAPVSSTPAAKPVPAGKLRKEPSQSDDDGSVKKRKGSILGGLFGRKKEKKEKGGSSIASMDSLGDDRVSMESNQRTSGAGIERVMSPVTQTAMEQQQQQSLNFRNSTDPKRLAAQAQQQQQQQTSPQQQIGQAPLQVLRQRDQQQQELYQQYLNRSPSSPPEADNYGLQTAATFNQSFNTSMSSTNGTGLGPPTSRPRPGSLILTPSAMDGQGVGVPDLSVIRVFAGDNLQTEATFKTVLLNTSTTSSDLVKQAIQRFRLPAGEDANNYFLTVKQMEGSSAVLNPDENPLEIFEQLVEEAMELPKVKRSSVGSISSVASNLSMHPAIKKLPMNDFTDDSAVKFYLNRRGSMDEDAERSFGTDGDLTITADTSAGSLDVASPRRNNFLTVSTANGNVPSERFSSPSFRFTLQLVIYPEDLPDDMVFDPLTEAIVFKHTLKERPSSTLSSPGVSPAMRRKVFSFPKNVTGAEVIELGLERFGILEGVVDGGDEVEDKASKRRSAVRVRYWLCISVNGQERELNPSHKVVDSFPRPPTFRTADRHPDRKRRSIDSAQILANPEDIGPEDPIFVLRRATSYRTSTHRHRLSAPLDEIALANMHREYRESASSFSTDTSSTSAQVKQPSKQEIIAAQRAASREKQLAILSTQSNSLRGVDVMLPGNAMLRSSRYDTGDRMRYSYVEPDGETYDISDIIEAEWRGNNPLPQKGGDLLQGVVATRNKDEIGGKLERVLSKIPKSGKATPQPSNSFGSSLANRSSTYSQSSEYSLDGGTTESRAVTPMAMAGGRSTTPTANTMQGSRARQLSVVSNASDQSAYATPTATSPQDPQAQYLERATTATPKGAAYKKRLIIPPDDFGVSHMMAIIEHRASVGRPRKPRDVIHPVDELLFGREIDVNVLHPSIRDVYQDGFNKLNEMDKVLDEFLASGLPQH